MHLMMAIVIGGLFAAGTFLILRRSIVRLIVGLVVLAHAANLLILTAGGLTRGAPPVIPQGAYEPQGAFANPLPQALILTAIVIGLAVQAFVLVLIRRVSEATGTGDVDAIRTTE
jgi:multicomponent Na+:H+ antiporter subunit C